MRHSAACQTPIEREGSSVVEMRAVHCRVGECVAGLLQRRDASSAIQVSMLVVGQLG